jgi:hypothetical protein
LLLISSLLRMLSRIAAFLLNITKFL